MAEYQKRQMGGDGEMLVGGASIPREVYLTDAEWVAAHTDYSTSPTDAEAEAHYRDMLARADELADHEAREAEREAEERDREHGDAAEGGAL